MFDTSVVRSRAVAAPQRVTLVAVSVALHSVIIAGVILTAIASIDFPRTAPDQFEVFRPMATLPPPPPPPPGPAKTPDSGTKSQPVQQPAVITAPVTIPDRPAEPVQPQAGPSDGVGEPDGVAGGEPDGVAGGTPGGTGDVLQPETGGAAGVPYQPGGEVRAARILTRVEPVYPRAFLSARLPSVVVTVRCVIDRNGRPRGAEVIRSSYPPFNAAVLEALERWTFAPGSRRGEAVDTWFELTVRFNVR